MSISLLKETEKTVNNSIEDYITLSEYNNSFKIYPSSFNARISIVPYENMYPNLFKNIYRGGDYNSSKKYTEYKTIPVVSNVNDDDYSSYKNTKVE